MLIQVREGKKPKPDQNKPIPRRDVNCINSVRYKVTLWVTQSALWSLSEMFHIMEPSPHSAPWVNQGKSKAGMILVIPVWFSTMEISPFPCSAATQESFHKYLHRYCPSATERVSLRLWQTQRKSPPLMKSSVLVLRTAWIRPSRQRKGEWQNSWHNKFSMNSCHRPLSSDSPLKTKKFAVFPLL